jgi:hypothetical protein
VLGRCIAGLSKAIVLRLAERDDLDHVRATTAQLAQVLAACLSAHQTMINGSAPCAATAVTERASSAISAGSRTAPIIWQLVSPGRCAALSADQRVLSLFLGLAGNGQS